MRLLPDIHPGGGGERSQKQTPHWQLPANTVAATSEDLSYQAREVDKDNYNNEIDGMMMRSMQLRDLLQQKRVSKRLHLDHGVV